MKGMKDLQIKLKKLEKKEGKLKSKSISKLGHIKRYIWCNSIEHLYKKCEDFVNTL